MIREAQNTFLGVRGKIGWIILLLLPAASCSESRTPQGYSVTVEAGPYRRLDAPVSVTLPAGIRAARLVEVTEKGERPVASQVETGEGESRLHWVLDGETPAGTLRRFRVLSQAAPEASALPPTVSVLDLPGESLELRLRDRAVLRYNYGIVEPPDPDIPRIQARNAYIHPLWSPTGRLITDDFSPDHLHQRGLWFAWTKTEFEGRHPDFWNLGSGTGTVRFAGMEGTTSGPVFGGFRVRHNHVDLSSPGGEVEALRETWDLKLFAAGGQDRGESFFLFDLFSVQECAGNSPLILPEYRYGGLAFRGSAEWRGDRQRVRTSEGRTLQDADRSAAVWCQSFGGIEGENAGIAILSHPRNYRSPQPLRVFPGEPYFCWAPTQQGAMSIRPGEPYVSRYRFVVFDGDLKPERMEQLWNDYAHPPVVTLHKDTE